MHKLVNVFWVLIAALIIGSVQAQTPEKSGDEILLERIRAAATNQATELDLSRLYVRELPDELWQLTQLQTLNLRENELDYLPPDIGRLTNLQSLDLSYPTSSRQGDSPYLPPEIGQLVNLKVLLLRYNRRIDVLPPEIGQLSNLQILDIRGSKINVLPAEVGQLKQLTMLDLSQTSISVVPPEIGQLTNLKELFIRDTKITGLPAEIGQLKNLSLLDLSENLLIELPPDIGQLDNLGSFYLSHTSLTGLPPEFGRLSKLKSLVMNESQIATLPPEFGRLINLETLTLDYAPLTALPPEFGGLINLHTLTMSNTLLSSLPPEIGQLSHLTKLEIWNTPLASLPPEIGRLSRLELLYLNNTAISVVPPEIGQLSNLKWLNLGHTLISSLPPEIGQLSNLEVLSLSTTSLDTLPAEIGQLSNLDTLNLDKTSMSSLPPEIGQLSNLDTLNLSDTPISRLPPEIALLGDLDTLDLSRTQLTEIPAGIYELASLNTLSIYGIPIKTLPRDLLLIPDLTVNYDRTINPNRVHIRWLLFQTQSEISKPLELMVLDFNNSQTEIELEMLCACWSSGPRDVFDTFLAMGEPPDIVGPMSYSQSQTWTSVWLDLQPLIEASGYDLSTFPAPLVNSFRTSDGLIALPLESFPGVLYYNVDLFDAAGLNYPPTVAGEPYIMPDGSAVPWDYDTVAKIGPLLTLDAEGQHAASPDFDPSHIVQFGFVHQWDLLTSDFSTFGGGMLLDETGQVRLPDHWRAQAHWMWDAIWRDHFMPSDLQIQNDYLGNPFASGHVAMARTMSWYTCCLDDLTSRWDLAIQPAYEGTIYAPNDIESFFITRASLHHAEAFTVLDYFSGEAATTLTEIFNAFPALPAAQPAAIERLSQRYPAVQNWDVLAASLPLAPYPHHDSGYPNFSQGQQRMNDFLILLRSEQGATLDLDAELDKLVADLQMIVDQ